MCCWQIGNTGFIWPYTLFSMSTSVHTKCEKSTHIHIHTRSCMYTRYAYKCEAMLEHKSNGIEREEQRERMTVKQKKRKNTFPFTIRIEELFRAYLYGFVVYVTCIHMGVCASVLVHSAFFEVQPLTAVTKIDLILCVYTLLYVTFFSSVLAIFLSFSHTNAHTNVTSFFLHPFCCRVVRDSFIRVCTGLMRIVCVKKKWSNCTNEQTRNSKPK